MALHRDIHWVGRQWAVTGFGIQAIDQRLKGGFDIEVSRLWDEIAVERTRALAWLNAVDFDKALEIARARHPEPAQKKLPLVESVLKMIQPAGAETAKVAPSSPLIVEPKTVEPKTVEPKTVEAKAVEAKESEPVAIAPPPQVDPLPALRMERASAKFLQMWRVR